MMRRAVEDVCHSPPMSLVDFPLFSLLLYPRYGAFVAIPLLPHEYDKYATCSLMQCTLDLPTHMLCSRVIFKHGSKIYYRNSN